jgi:hypothetical protein
MSLTQPITTGAKTADPIRLVIAAIGETDMAAFHYPRYVTIKRLT